MIDPNTCRIYVKKIPAKQTLELHIKQVDLLINKNELCNSEASDVRNPLYSY